MQKDSYRVITMGAFDKTGPSSPRSPENTLLCIASTHAHSDVKVHNVVANYSSLGHYYCLKVSHNEIFELKGE